MQFKLFFPLALLAIANSKCMAAPIPTTSTMSDAAAKGVVGSNACYTAECFPPPKHCSKWDKDLNHCVQWNDEHIPRPTLSERDITEIDISEVETDKVDTTNVEAIEVDATKVGSRKRFSCDNCFPYFSVRIL